MRNAEEDDDGRLNSFRIPQSAFRLQVFPLSEGRRLRAAPTLRRRLHREALVQATDPEAARNEFLMLQPQGGRPTLTPQSTSTNDEA
jgi:hypothetical protein